MPIFDTHAHYDSNSFRADRDEVLSALPAAGVSLVVDPGCDLESSREAIALAERFPHVWAAAGIHPSDCAGTGDAELAVLRDLCGHEKLWPSAKSGWTTIGRTTRRGRSSSRFSGVRSSWLWNWTCPSSSTTGRPTGTP